MTPTRFSLTAVTTIAAAAFAGGLLVATVSPAVFASPQEQDRDVPEMPDMQSMMPGPHHEHLKQLAGNWEGHFKWRMNPGDPMSETTGEVTREWVLDGHYLRERVDSETPMGAFEGLGYLGFNNHDGVYEMVWMDNYSTAIHHETGSYDPETKTFTFRGTARHPISGKLVHGEGQWVAADTKQHVYVGYSTGPDGKRYKSFEAKYTKK